MGAWEWERRHTVRVGNPSNVLVLTTKLLPDTHHLLTSLILRNERLANGPRLLRDIEEQISVCVRDL